MSAIPADSKGLVEQIVESQAKANAELRAIIERPLAEVIEREFRVWLIPPESVD